MKLYLFILINFSISLNAQIKNVFYDNKHLDSSEVYQIKQDIEKLISKTTLLKKQKNEVIVNLNMYVMNSFYGPPNLVIDNNSYQDYCPAMFYILDSTKVLTENVFLKKYVLLDSVGKEFDFFYSLYPKETYLTDMKKTAFSDYLGYCFSIQSNHIIVERQSISKYGELKNEQVMIINYSPKDDRGYGMKISYALALRKWFSKKTLREMRSVNKNK